MKKKLLPLPRIAVVIVTYNSESNIISCIQSLQNTNYQKLNIFITDNNSTDQTLAFIHQFSKIHLLKNKRNRGFAAAVNQSIRKALLFGCEYILILNDDAFLQKDFFTYMIPKIHVDQPAIVGVAITYIKSPNILWFAGGYMNRFFCYTRHIGKQKPVHFLKKSIHDPSRVDFVTGCAMIIHRSIFRAIGLFTEEYFYSFEDVSFCLRARKFGYSCYVYHKALIAHVVSASSGDFGSELSTTRGRYLGRNTFLLMKEVMPWYMWPSNILGQISIRFPYYIWLSIKERKWKFLYSYMLGIIEGFGQLIRQAPCAPTR